MMTTLGYLLFFSGLLLWSAGEVMILTVAYRRGLGCFFACLFLPVFYWIFLVINVRNTARPFALAVLGFLATALGGYMVGFEWPGSI